MKFCKEYKRARSSEVCEPEKMRHLRGDWLIYYSAKFHPFRSVSFDRLYTAPLLHLLLLIMLPRPGQAIPPPRPSNSTPRGASTFFNIIISSSSSSVYLLAYLPTTWPLSTFLHQHHHHQGMVYGPFPLSVPLCASS